VHVFYSARRGNLRRGNRFFGANRVRAFRGTEGGIVGKPTAQGDKSVLIVDDDAVCRLFCEQALSGRDHRILLAATAEAAIGLARVWQPALIVLDLHLRECSGQSVRTIILQHWSPGVAPPVFIAMTGDDQQVRESRPLAGFSAVLSKPFRAEQLGALVHQALAQCPAIGSECGISPVSAAEKLERALRAEWAVGLAELDQHIAALDWSKATHILHRLCGAAAVAGHPELAQGARRLMKEIAREAKSVEMTSAYADILWQGAGFTGVEPEEPASFKRCESVDPFL